MPDSQQGSHFGVTDFRTGNKIFATLAYEKEGYGVLMLTPEQQSGMLQDAPELFSPVPNSWGRRGATRVSLKEVSEDILEAALRMAWKNKRSQPNRVRRSR